MSNGGKIECSDLLPNPGLKSGKTLRVRLLTSFLEHPEVFDTVNDVLAAYFELRETERHQERATNAAEKIKQALKVVDGNNGLDKGSGITGIPTEFLRHMAWFREALNPHSSK